MSNISQINFSTGSNSEDVLFDRLSLAGRDGNRGIAITFFDPTNAIERMKANFFVDQLETSGQPVPEFLATVANKYGIK